MPLTKARPPVTAISQMSNTTTQIDMPSAAGPIDIDVNGVDVLDITQTTMDAQDTVTATIRNMVGRVMNFIFAAGATLNVESTASQGQVRTTTAHPLELGSNSLDNLTLETTGRVTLGTVGALAAELIDKNYVDTQITANAGTNVAVTSENGYIRLPNSTGNDLFIQWGRVTGLITNSNTVVTFPIAFPNAALNVVSSSINSGFGTLVNEPQVVSGISTTQFSWFNPPGIGSLNPTGYWMAIGF